MPEPLSLDPELAARADALFRELGLDLSTAVRLFLLQSLREHGLPFTPRLTAPAPERRAGTSPAEAAPSPSESGTVPSGAEAGLADAATAEEYAAPAEEEATAAIPAEEAPSETGSEATEAETASLPAAEEPSGPETAPEEGELQQAFRNAGLMGRELRRIRSLNRLYAIGEPNPNVKGWREVYVSGDEPFALDFGIVRVELGYHGGGSIRMMDGRLPDEVLEADAVYPRDLSAVFSTIIGQALTGVSTSRLRGSGQDGEQINLHFANGCTLSFAPGGDWGALWLADAHGSVMFAPDAVWLRVLDDRALRSLR